MDLFVSFLLFAGLLLVVSMAGAIVPHIKVLSDRQAHLLVSLSAGIFLGLLFIMLLPEAFEESEHGGFDTHEVVYVLLAGFLIVMVIETWMKHRNLPTCGCKECLEAYEHKVTSAATFVGLSIHAVCDGLVIAASFYAGETIGLLAMIGMCIHKFVELFSLSSTMLLTDMDTRNVMKWMLLFSLLTPVAGILLFLLFGEVSMEGVIGLPLAFASGTFMYVAICDLLPEAFHRRDQDAKSLVLVVLGIALMVVLNLIFPHAH